MRKILITGNRGLVGSACVRHFSKENHVVVPTESLFSYNYTEWLMSSHVPDVVIHCAAKVGGVDANRRNPVSFMEENLQLQTNVISAAAHHKVPKLVFMGTSCMFPKDAACPVAENSLLTGRLEDSVEAYAIAKLAGWRLCKAYYEERGFEYLTAALSNVYGPGDNYSPDAHVIPALIRRVYEAKRDETPLTVWGDGSAVREFIVSSDVASAIDSLIDGWHSPEVINIGTGQSTTIRELVDLIVAIAGFGGPVVWDESKPTGIQRKTFDITQLRGLGWTPSVALAQGLLDTWVDFNRAEKVRGYEK